MSSHWRDDPLTGRRVRVAPGRDDRPSDFARSEERRCPFCAGAEHDTPPELDRIASGDDGGWTARAIPNRYPAVEGDDGAQEVIVESPRHVERFVDLTPDEATAAVTLWARRLDHWRRDARFAYRLVFKNEGAPAGASLSHVHSQVLTLPSPPPTAAPFATAAPEPPAGLAVAERDGFAAYCPQTSRMAFETAIVDTAGGAPFTELANSPERAAALAALLQDLLRAIARASRIESYNLMVLTPPTGSPNEESWRIDVTPRSAQIAGFELATGLWINAVPPEDAARGLRRELGSAATR